jgi:DNA primase
MRTRLLKSERAVALQTLTESQREFMTEATEKYSEAFPNSPASLYLQQRNIDPEKASSMFRLGHVSEPLPSHERFAGMLAIPYIAKSGTVGFKFRRLDDNGPKYLAPENSRVRLYNVLDVFMNTPQVLIVEGELDCVTAKIAGVPAVVGVSGAQNWKPHFARVLDGFEEVIVCVDNDVDKESGNAGQQLAQKILRDIPHARNVVVASGLDINALYSLKGHEGLFQTLGLKVESEPPE